MLLLHIASLYLIINSEINLIGRLGNLHLIVINSR
jgi:hypothetical protein